MRIRTPLLLMMTVLLAASCADGSESGSTATVAPTTTGAPTTTYDIDETMDGVREEAVDQQFILFGNWMDNYRSHPVLGRHWTEGEAECAIVTMIRVEGVARSGALMNGASVGNMSAEDAISLVQPVGFCTDLLALMRGDMVELGVPQDPDCLLAGVTEEDVAKWFVALFMHGRDGFNGAMGEDLDLTCPTGS